MLKKALLSLLVLPLANMLSAQTTYLQLGQEDYHLLDRIETRSGALTNEYCSTTKPIARKGAVAFLEEARQNARGIGLSTIDRYNIDHMVSVSGEWAANEDGAIDSKVPWFRTFYKKQPDFVHVKTDNFFLAINPVISITGMHESNTIKSDNHFTSGRGAEFRGWISKKIGFYTFFTDNQEQLPSYVAAWTAQHEAVPGADYYTVPAKSSHYDYLLARGYIDFAAVKDHVNVTFGYDKHFIGDGMTSLLLSDFSAGATFLRLNTRIWKVNYQNLYLELTPQFEKGVDSRLPHKYATIHHLSMNVTKWLNLGVFESVIFSRRDRYEFSYMIPIIFYRSVERGLGSPDNANIGFNFKAIAAKHLQFYGQLLFDELKTKELFGGRGWWGNKYGIQVGGKYFDAFGLKNLDLQGEVNIVRPYTYSHYDSTSNYTHYNQPLAHPLGADFGQVLGRLDYQPVKNLYITIRGMYYKQGVDTGSANFGSDIFKNYNTRSDDYGVGMINGVRVTCMQLGLDLSYKLRENLFIDLGASRRMYSYQKAIMPDFTSNYVYGGIRLNIAKRDYNFY